MNKDTSHQNLKLYLSQEIIDFSDIDVIKTFNTIHDGFKIEVGILGTSHYVKIEEDGDLFYEVLSCSDIKGTGKMFPIDSFRKSKSISKFIPFFGIDYTFDIDVLFLDESKKRYDEFLTSKSTLIHEFPGPSGGEFKPYTVIRILTLEKLVFETMHVYPEENIVVFTHSTIS